MQTLYTCTRQSIASDLNQAPFRLSLSMQWGRLKFANFTSFENRIRKKESHKNEALENGFHEIDKRTIYQTNIQTMFSTILLKII